MFFLNRLFHVLTISLVLAVSGNWCPAVAQSPASADRPERMPEAKPFPLWTIARELAAKVEQLPREKQVFLFYEIIPKWLRRAVFWNLSTPTQEYLNSAGMRLTVQQFPHLQSGLNSLETKAKAILAQAGRERHNPQTLVLRGQSFLSVLKEDERALWTAFTRQFFSTTFYENGYRTLTLTPAGAQSLLQLVPFSPTLNKVLSQKQFIPENQPGRVGDGVFTVSMDEIPIVKKAPAPPDGEEGTGKKGRSGPSDDHINQRHSEPRKNNPDDRDDRPDDSSSPVPAPFGMSTGYALCNCFMSETCPPSPLPPSSHPGSDRFYYLEPFCSPEPECMNSLVPPPPLDPGYDEPIFYPPSSPCSSGWLYIPCSGRCSFLYIEVHCCN